jgi:DNA helicase II / ATP-dependent DNA helicase PcrA
LKDDPALLEEERSRTRFLLVDEFQDANFAQSEIMSLLAGREANVFAVGDPDQAIYSFAELRAKHLRCSRRIFPQPES